MAKRVRPPVVRLHNDLVVDNFAGGGGASLGIEWAMGRSPDIAINHDAKAIAMHRANHPDTQHFAADVWDVDPEAATRGYRIALAWFSPDCTHHSKARGAKPRSERVRGLAWVVIKWASIPNRPRVIVLENVEEFEDWGPLDECGFPVPEKKGLTFRRWLGQLRACGYRVEMRQLRACDYGAPTSRKRLFIIARCDGLPIVWPDFSHGEGLAPYRTAGECIEWTVPAPSIFERERPHVDNTLRRIARGVSRYVLETASPFIYPVTHQRDARVWSVDDPFRTITGAHRGEIAVAVPTLIQRGWGERPGQAPRVPGLEKPIGTICAQGEKHELVCAFLAKHYSERATGGWAGGSSLVASIGTITSRDHHGLVAAHLMKYYGTSTGSPMDAPMPTITSGGGRGHGGHLAEVRSLLYRFEGERRAGLPIVRVGAHDYVVADIGSRMLIPRELFRGQGFPDSYRIDVEYDEGRLTKTDQIRLCGNSVPPVVVRDIVVSNLHRSRMVA